MHYLRSISSQPFFCTLIGISDVSTSSSNDAYSSGITSMVKLFRRSSNSSSGSSVSKDTSENPYFLKQCFIVFLVICSNPWFTHLIHCRRSTPWIISDVFYPLSIIEITCFKSCSRYLTLKFRMILASQGCNWEVVFLGKNTSLMFLRFFWRVSGWNGALSRSSKTFSFRHLVYGLSR